MSVPAAGTLAAACLSPARLARALEAAAALRDGEGGASDEALWLQVAQAFTVDRSIVNLNNGGVSPSPAVVQEAMKRHLDYSNTAPAWTMWKVLEPQREAVRRQLAEQFGADPEELALTRNASEGLQICQLGIDLEPGDEVLTTTQDYPRMITAFRQRERRDGIVLRRIQIPVGGDDPDEIVRRFESAITPRTRLILACHVVNLTGQILPVRRIVAMARYRSIPVIVDGAHALAHLDTAISDLDCDLYASSLHKWLFAPHGTGLLYVRREMIRDLWPLMAAPPEMDGDIRKFEEVGTHPAANHLAIAEALAFHQAIGPKRKLARMLYLRDYWAGRLLEYGRVRLHTSLRPGAAGGFATVQVDGVDSVKLSDRLWSEHRILTVAIKHEEFEGVRVSPSVYTTTQELDRFVDAMVRIIRDGLPA